MDRRDVLRGAAAFAGFAAAFSAGRKRALAANPPVVRPRHRMFVPGYDIDAAYYEGTRTRAHARLARGVPKDYEGSVRMLTRLDLAAGSVKQALFPVHGHDVAISPDGRIGVYASLEHRSFVSFDAETLDVLAIGAPHARGWIGGGHSVFLDEKTVAVTERAPRRGYRGAPEPHFGAITIREAETLKVLEHMNCHGVSPHEIRLSPDGRQFVVANYGSTYPEGGRRYGVPRHIVEPSVTLVGVESGRLEEKYAAPSTEAELRHLCVTASGDAVGITARLGLPDEDQAFRQGDAFVYARELTAGENSSYLPAKPVRLDRASGAFAELGGPDVEPLMRHGLSIEYDAVHDEALATFPAAHRVMAFDGATGALKRSIDTAAMGLDYPCGVAVLEGSDFYAVAGYWKNLYIFERGGHGLRRDLCSYATFFGHSHMTAF